MPFSPNGYDPNLVMLAEIEVARELDTLTWIQAAAPNTACWYVSHPEKEPSKVEIDGVAISEGGVYGTDDVPATRGTEWDQDTAKFIDTGAHVIGCGHVDGNYIYVADADDHKVKLYNKTTGAFVRETSAHGLINEHGITSDGTYFYLSAYQNLSGSKINKYKISDASYVAQFAPAFGTGAGQMQYAADIGYANGFLWVSDSGAHKLVKITAATMAYASEVAITVSNWGNTFCLEPTGTYFWTGVLDGGVYYFTKRLLTDFSEVITSGALGAGASLYGYPLFYYADGSQVRIFANAGTDAYKMNPATCLAYYGAFNTAYAPSDVAVDGDYIYTFISTYGVRRRLMNDIGSYEHAPSLAGCQEDVNSYYYDSANTRLYVHITGGGSPAVATPYILSFHWRRLSTDVEEFGARSYLPVLPADSIPSVSSSTGRFHENGTALSFGKIKILNGDGRFDTLFDIYIWEAKRVIVRLGEKGKGDANYIVIFDGWTGDIEWNDDFVEIGTEDLRTLVI
jgi:hypothetical protein